MKMKKICLGLLSFMVCGCYASKTPPPPPPSAPSFKPQIAQIETAGMKIIQQADRLIIIIPTDSYFEPMSTKVKDERQNDLKKMALFVKKFSDRYPLSVIKVVGYTDQVFNNRSQLEYSQRYASVVSSYIFDVGIPENRIATEGRGSSEPLAAETNAHQAALNRRVVIQVN